jgi:hypothetical protein
MNGEYRTVNHYIDYLNDTEFKLVRVPFAFRVALF